jgi:uncharacterized membrane protein YfcA
MAEFTSLALMGLAVGLIVGLTGVGAGAVMTPVLIGGFGIPASVAVGTDLAVAAVSKTAGTVAHRASRNISRSVVIAMASGSIPAALATLLWLSMAGLAPEALNHLIRTSVGVALLISIGALLLRQPLRRWGAAHINVASARTWRPALTAAVGVAVGIAVVLSSLGAGAIGAAFIAMLYPELEPAEIAGSDIAHAVPLTAIAAAGHAWMGTVDAQLAVPLLVGSIPGIVVGSLAARAIPTRWLRYGLIGTLGLAAAKLLH